MSNANVPKNQQVAEKAVSFDLQELQRISRDVAGRLEGQALNSIVQGFSFAAAMSWMDVSRWAISRVVKGSKNSGLQYTLTATMTSLLSILVYLIVSAVSKRVIKPTAPLYAITR
jgi:hypothetical protein